MSPDIEVEQEDPERDEADVDAEDDDYGHLKSLDDGAGCTEVWEHLSESREE